MISNLCWLHSFFHFTCPCLHDQPYPFNNVLNSELSVFLSAITAMYTVLTFQQTLYFLSKTHIEMSWPEAELACIEHGGHLASIHSDEEQTYLVQEIASR